MGGWSDDGGKDYIKWMGRLRGDTVIGQTVTGAIVSASSQFEGQKIVLTDPASAMVHTIQNTGGVLSMTSTDGETFGTYLYLDSNNINSSFWFGGTSRLTFNASRVQPNSGAAGSSGADYTYSGGDYTSSGTDLNGGTANISGGASTGAGNSSVVIKAAQAGLSGTTEHTPIALMTLAGRVTSVSPNLITLADATNFVLGSTTGNKIGSTTTEKLGFYGKTPVVQQTATTDLGTALSNLGLRATGTAYPITTSGVVTLTGGLTTNSLILTGAMKSYNDVAFNYLKKSASYAMAKGDCGIIGVTDTSAVRYITLPQSQPIASGAVVTIKDEGGQAGTNFIYVRNNIGDFIDGIQTSKAISTSYGYASFYRAGSGAWMSIN